MLDFPKTPFPPLRIHLTGETVLVVGVDGELVHLNPQTLHPASDSAKPFPSSIQHSVVADGKFIGTWTEYELQIARMAAISFSEPFQDGVTRSELRIALRGGDDGDEGGGGGGLDGGTGGGTNLGESDKASTNPVELGDVAGAEWSHVLEGEPLCIATNGERIVFCMYGRGIYCTDTNSTEFWRQPVVEWLDLNHLPDGSHILSMSSAPDPDDPKVERIWLWSLGGGWAYYSWENGDLLAQGVLGTEFAIEAAWSNGLGEWLVTSPPQTVVRWKLGGEAELGSVNGPVNSARWENDGWSMAGWRENLRWDNLGLKSEPRQEIGMAIYDHPKKGSLVLDNTGNWSKFSTP